MFADARAATALASASFAVVLADARAATALASVSSAVVFANARAPTLSAKVLLSIVGALLADRRHLQVLCAFCCFLQTSQSQREAARSTKHLREAARSAKREASANEQQALVKCAGLWAEERKVFWGFYFEEIFHGFEGQKRSFK